MSKTSDFQITGKHVLIGCVLFFAGVIAANGWMAYQAITTFDGVEREDAYRKGRDYNSVIEEAQRQAELGWQIAVVAEVSGIEPQVTLNVDVRNRGGDALNNLDINAVLWRPVDDGQDLHIPLRAVGAGQYQGTADLPAHGQWDVRLRLQDTEGNRLDHIERIVIKAAA